MWVLWAQPIGLASKTIIILEVSMVTGMLMQQSTLLSLSLYSEQSIAPYVGSYVVKSPLNYYEEDQYLWHEVDLFTLMVTTGTATF